MEAYKTPEIEIVEFDSSDVITTSTQFPDIEIE